MSELAANDLIRRLAIFGALNLLILSLILASVSVNGNDIFLGFILGFVVTKTNFCTMGAVSDWVNIGDLSRFKAWMLAAAVAILGVTILDFLSFFDIDDSRIPYRNSVLAWPRYILA